MFSPIFRRPLPPRTLTARLRDYPLRSSRRSFATEMSSPGPVPTSSKSELWVPPSNSSSTHSVFSLPIHQSPHDDRSYRIIRLANDLQAVVVSDPDTDKAAASLSVGVGHLSDPEDRPGLAHFCEHLLFMVRVCCGFQRIGTRGELTRLVPPVGYRAIPKRE